LEEGKVVERQPDTGVVGPQCLLADGERALVEGLGLGIAALVLVKRGQIIETPSTTVVTG
jgi:hypothetical protein